MKLVIRIFGNYYGCGIRKYLVLTCYKKGEKHAFFQYFIFILFSARYGGAVPDRPGTHEKYGAAFGQPFFLRMGRAKVYPYNGDFHCAGLCLWTFGGAF